MKKKGLTITLLVVGAVVVLLLILLIAIGIKKDGGDVDDLQTTYGTVQMMEMVSDTMESSYQVGAALPGTDFSAIGQILADKMAQEWDAFNKMTQEQRMVSSKAWGVVGIQVDTWDECEEAIGFAVYNPLESLDWLNKTGYYGMESTNPDIPVAHVQTMANFAINTDGKLREIDVTAGYNNEKVKITLTAIQSANSGTYISGSACNGYATYGQNTVSTGSGIPVLIVTTNETNNTGYYNDNYFDLTAYWVIDNVFYILRVFGEETHKDEIQNTIERILEEI